MNRGPLCRAPVGPVCSSPLAVTMPCSSAPRAEAARNGTVNVWGTDAVFQIAPCRLLSSPPYVSLDQDLGHGYHSHFSDEGAT